MVDRNEKFNAMLAGILLHSSKQELLSEKESAQIFSACEQTMNNVCCKAAISAALGSRGLLLHESQCIFIKKPPCPLSAQSSLRTARLTRPSHRRNRQASLFVVHSSDKESAGYVLLKTTECADGSVVFKFGFSEQQFSVEAKERRNEDSWATNGSARIHKNSIGIAEKYAQESNMQKAEELKFNGSSNNPDVILNSAAAMIPHPDKVMTGGEDAYFIDGTRWVGVADGVPGFDFARELMENCAETARQVRGSSDPKSVLVYAARQTKSEGLAATLIASLYDRTLQVANIGNSGFVVLRNFTVVARSKPMIRGINFPYQIGTAGDDPSMAEVYAVQVQRNDVVILGSDGIWDNLFEKQVIEVVKSVQTAGGEPGVVAHKLVMLASRAGREREGISPFATAAHAAGYTDYLGGKLNDATAVVSFVT